MKVQQLSDVPYMGAPYSSWYIEYDQETKTVRLDGIEIPTKIAFDVINNIKEQLKVTPERGHHYDVFRHGDVIRIGMAGHNVTITRWDIPSL